LQHVLHFSEKIAAFEMQINTWHNNIMFSLSVAYHIILKISLYGNNGTYQYLALSMTLVCEFGFYDCMYGMC